MLTLLPDYTPPPHTNGDGVTILMIVVTFCHNKSTISRNLMASAMALLDAESLA
ncbi:hypothetical protein [Aeromonas cavernicola]|uniref:hypothetical protein n=1 Tax=Aeromonas cavernicola TaxID=1006623 RepID=UPI0012FE45BB|nr:hypothetical protein [Aeromonas cavernicola]